MKWHVWYWLVIAALGTGWLVQHDHAVRARALAEQRADSLHLAQRVLAAAAQEMLRRQHEDSTIQRHQVALIRREADSLRVSKVTLDSISGALRAALPTDSLREAFDSLRAVGAQREGLLMAGRDSALVLLAQAGQSRDSIAGLLRQSLAQSQAYQVALQAAIRKPFLERGLIGEAVKVVRIGLEVRGTVALLTGR